MKTPTRQLATQDFKYRHESHISMEISKAIDLHLMWQEWRDGREKLNMEPWGIPESEAETKMEPETWAEEQWSQGNRKLSAYQQTRAFETSIM